MWHWIGIALLVYFGTGVLVLVFVMGRVLRRRREQDSRPVELPTAAPKQRFSNTRRGYGFDDDP